MKSKKIINAFIAVVLIGLMIWGMMLILTWNFKTPNALLIELGKTGATLALVTAIGGLVQWILKTEDLERETRKETITFYRNLLSDFKSVYDKMEKARLLIHANRTAKTYGEQMRSLIENVVTLNNIKRALNPEFPVLQKELSTCIDKMQAFIDNLLVEYGNNYKRLSILQEIDEKKKQQLIEERMKTIDSKIEVANIPSIAWKEIEKLENLSAIKDEKSGKYKIDFLDYLDQASEILRKRIPVKEGINTLRYYEKVHIQNV